MNGCFPGRTATDLVPMLYRSSCGGAMLPYFTQWGSYTIVYYTQSGDELCADCAGEILLSVLEGEFPYPDYTPVICDAPGESEYDMRCCECRRILVIGYDDDNGED